MGKKVVTYKPGPSMIVLGLSALVRPVNHTSELVSNTKYVRTSPVIKYDSSSGRFETENSIYVPST